MPARSFGTWTWVSVPGTISVGLVDEQPALPEAPDAAIVAMPSASAFEFRLRMESLRSNLEVNPVGSAGRPRGKIADERTLVRGLEYKVSGHDPASHHKE